MYKIILSLLFFASITAKAQSYRNNSTAADNNFEIVVLGGKAINLSNLTLMRTKQVKAFFPGIYIYKNFNNWQLGLGFDAEVSTFKGQNRIDHKIPQILFNRTHETNSFGFYAGIMVGYSSYKFTSHSNTIELIRDNKTTGNGPVAGIQAGILLKLASFIAINLEVAPRIRNIKYTYVLTESGNTYRQGIPVGGSYEETSVNSRQDTYMPVRAGLRFRF